MTRPPDPGRRSRLLSALLLVLLPLLIQAPALSGVLSADPLFREAWLSLAPIQQLLPGSGWADGNAGVTTQALGHLAAEDWLHGRLPWWNPYAGVGMPLAAEMQNSALFLPFMLLLHFANGLIWLKLCIEVLTGLFMLGLLRELGLGWRTAVVGGVLMELCGTLAWFSHAPIMPVPFLPLLVLGIERAGRLDARRQGAGIAIIALAIAGSIAAGFPETAFLDGLLAACIAGWRIVQAGRRWAGPAARIMLGGVIGIAISAPAWLPFIETLPISFLGQNDGGGNGSLLPASPAMLLFPYLFGPVLYGFARLPAGAALWWHTGGYVDLVVVSCAGMALVGRAGGRHRGLRLVLLGWLVASLMQASGIPLFDRIPGVRETVFHLYASPGWSFIAALLAALALDDLERDCGPSRRRVLAVALAALAGGTAAIACAWPSLRALAGVYPGYIVYPLLSLAEAGACILALVWLFMKPALRWAGHAAAAILVVDAALLFFVPVLSGTRHPQTDLGAVRYLRANIGLQRFLSVSLLAPNYGSYFGVASLNWNALPVPLAWTDRIGRDLGLGPDRTALTDWPKPTPQIAVETELSRLQALGVAYLVVPHWFDPSPTRPLQRVYADDVFAILRLPDPAPYFSSAAGHCRLEARSRERVAADCTAPDRLIRRELFYPGWQATKNGQTLPLHPAGTVFQAVDLPAGHAIVRFQYAPPHIFWAWLSSALGLGAVLLSWHVGRRRYITYVI